MSERVFSVSQEALYNGDADIENRFFDDGAIDYLFNEATQDLDAIKKTHRATGNPLLQMMNVETSEMIGYLRVFTESDWERLRNKLQYQLSFITEKRARVLTLLFKHKATTLYEVCLKIELNKSYANDFLKNLVGLLVYVRYSVQPMGAYGGKPATIYSLKDATESDIEDCRHRYHMLTLGHDPVEEERRRIEEQECQKRERIREQQEQEKQREEKRAQQIAARLAAEKERRRIAEEKARQEAEAEKERRRLEMERIEKQRQESERLREAIRKIYAETEEGLKDISENPEYSDDIKQEAEKWRQEIDRQVERDRKAEELNQWIKNLGQAPTTTSE